MASSNRHVDPQPQRPARSRGHHARSALIAVPRAATRSAAMPRGMQLALIAWCVLSSLAACSSGGCPEGTQRFGDRCVTTAAPEPSALTLVSAAPSDGASDFARQEPLVLTFSAALDASTVREDTVALRDGDVVVPADLLVQGAELRVTPRAKLSMLAEHVLTVTTQVRGTGGETPAQDITVRATTQDGAWQAPGYLETDNAGRVGGVLLRVDHAGNAMAVWKQSDGVRDNVWANRYEVGKGWLGPVLIEEENDGDAQSLRTVMDAAGNVTVVWDHYDGTKRDIRANFFDAAKGTWGNSTLLENSTNTASVERVIVDNQGTVTALWIQFNGTMYDLWAKRHAIGVGWVDMKLIDTSDAGDVGNATVVSDAQGNLTVVWNQRDGTRYDVWARRYEQGVWKEARLLEDDTANDAFFTSVLPDSAGNVTVLYRISPATGNQLFARRLQAGADWQDAVQLSGPSPWSFGYVISVIDSAGNITACWIEQNGSTRRVAANRYTAGQGWQQTQSVLTTEDVTDLQLGPNPVVDASGRVTIGWQGVQGDEYALFGSRYEPERGWLPAEKIFGDPRRLYWSQNWVVDSAGNITALFTKYEGESSSQEILWAVRRDAEGGWGNATALHAPDENLPDSFEAGSYLVDPTVDARGNVTVAWTRIIRASTSAPDRPPAEYRVFSNRYQARRGSWAGVQSLQPPPHDTANASILALAGDQQGNIFALSYQWAEGAPYNLIANRFE